METVYKLTDYNSKTRPRQSNETQWGPNVTHVAPGKGDMCTAGWIHAYSHPLLAVLLNPAHANYKPFQLWRCDAEVGIRRADKLGCTKLTTIEQVDAPLVSVAQRVAFAIRVALLVYKDEKFVVWAKNWLSGKDRSANAAYHAANDATATAAKAAKAANDAAIYATYASAYAAKAANDAGVAAAYDAGYAGTSAAKAAANLTDQDLLQCAEKALQEIQ